MEAIQDFKSFSSPATATYSLKAASPPPPPPVFTRLFSLPSLPGGGGEGGCFECVRGTVNTEEEGRKQPGYGLFVPTWHKYEYSTVRASRRMEAKKR